MRYGRSKAARKTLQFFERTQGIRAPYHILLDGTFLVALVKYNLPLQERLDRLLQHASYQLHVTQSSLDELERLANQVPDKKVLLEEAQQWAHKNCASILPKHETISNDRASNENSLEKLGIAAQDIWNWTAAGVSASKQTTTSHYHATQQDRPKYFVASHDEDLLDALRTMGGVPIIRLARGSVLLLEQPSKAATVQARATEQSKWKGSVSESEQRLVQVVVQHERQERQQQQGHPTVRRKRKAKEPNPLSCKKKGTTTEGPKKKRRRKSSQTGNDDAAA
ncbi:U3 small nucleolar RNA-associated protein 23 [Fistulifera solaris]|uniref:U3 small nucleolar RNA-associated protein 23 n=1 Tax=Fistulifera solaris TaxID=1519565 RepID=A0A1Z5JXG3_FISSO|nr:U3 small nucleolar RNA-associated protein 23 [Fistulifera solaris]|eukprot:GAX18508.1 U3 small nucleolar RNA-associated protein 23 [Fistulifera solaris]